MTKTPSSTPADFQTYLVGGAVRDRLLGYPFSEKDWVVVGATPEQMTDQGYSPVGKDFPVFLHPVTKEEYALARTERKTAPGYTGFSFYCAPSVTLEDDLSRRDLTINAIAQSECGELIDPYGGEQDLKHRLLRHVSPAFSEDPVRILRVARFAARYHHLGFTVADSTMALMREMVQAGEANHLVAERVWKELARALGEQNPEVFVQVLRDCGALDKVMPELDALFGVPQRAEHHPEIDTGIHCLMVLQQACKLTDSVAVRFAALMHDLGKGVTPKDVLPRHIGHEVKSLPLVKALCQRLAVPNDCRDLALITAEFHTHCHRALELKPSTVQKLFKRTDAYRKPERFNQFLLACEADSRGRTGFENRDYPQPDYLRTALEAVKEIDIQALIQQGYQGAELGQAIEQTRIKILQQVKQDYPHD
ncbi:multifunctional CCA addition/repair protein [Gilvimarinus xylanilyticus]|uniref:Multifunctional CCA protein n=1 Tax=Gilvimarinus xylanilyticus TaxID=2944139 RepID=A0A9X2KU32_9GAMM|nr:multifunctional CCA addition/repair protein [Gilvimarinus xylanilyticus]MCP8899413.1 multifunctional CCA addition/repair protein [Gilvimarinus xylanilyticus]